MSIVPYRSQGLTRSDARKLELFKRGVGKDLRGHEIDEAIEWCEIYGANPFVKDIYFFVFDADKPSRNVVPVLGIGLYRKIAARSGNYRPDDQPPRFRYDDARKSETNPKGIIDCEVSVHVFAHGDWHRVSERLRWEERAPIKQKWRDNQPTDEFYLDPKKKNWRDMPETMLAKCTEAACIRKAFPEETSGSYVDADLDRADTINLTATEIIEAEEQRQRFDRIGGRDCLTVDWIDGSALQRVPVGTFADQVLAWLRTQDGLTAATFEARNAETLKEYWARDKSGALELKRQFEKAKAETVEAAE